MSEQDYYDDLLGRGPGDPDVYGYPGQIEVPDNYYENKLIESIEAADEQS